MLKIGLQLVIWPSQIPAAPGVQPGSVVQSHPAAAVQSAQLGVAVPVQRTMAEEPLVPESPAPPSGPTATAGTQLAAHCTTAHAT
jgi:hypothetical protein